MKRRGFLKGLLAVAAVPAIAQASLEKKEPFTGVLPDGWVDWDEGKAMKVSGDPLQVGGLTPFEKEWARILNDAGKKMAANIDDQIMKLYE